MKIQLLTAIALSIVTIGSAASIPLLNSPQGWQVFTEGGVHFYKWSWDDEAFHPAHYPYPLETSPVRGPVIEDGVVDMFSNQYSGDAPGHPFKDPNGEWWSIMYAFYTMGVQRTLNLRAGDIISGGGWFRTWDYPPYADYAMASVNDTVVWRYGIEDAWRDEPDGVLTHSGSGNWSFTAPADGAYTLKLSLYGDSQLESEASFGAHLTVPEVASTFWLLVGALGLIPPIRRYAHKR